MRTTKTKNFNFTSKFRLLSKIKSSLPLSTSALALAACGNGDTSSSGAQVSTQSGVALKGLLEDLRIFVDANRNGVYDAGETNVLSAADGSFSLSVPAGSALSGEITSTTLDHASGRIIEGLFLSAPSGAAILSPMTTIIEQTGLSETEVRQALGITVNLLQYNPFLDANVDASEARAVEHVAQQIANITRGLTAVGEGAGLSSRAAFDIASTAFNSVLAAHVTAGTPGSLDLWGDATMTSVLDAYRAGLMNEGHSAHVFDTLRTELDAGLDIINQRILAVVDLTSAEAEAVFGLPSDLYAEIKAAATAIAAGNANPGLSLDSWTAIIAKTTENGYTPPAPPAPAGAAPVLTVNAPAAAFTVQSDIDATLEMTGGAVLGNLLAGNNFTLTTSAAVATGTLFARANGQTSAVSAQTFTLGTAGNDVIDTSGAGARVDYILSGDGNDNIDAGMGNDHIIAGDGNDTIDGGAGNDGIYAGDGDDTVTADENDGEVRGGNGTDTLTVAQAFDPNVINQFAEFERLNITANNLTVSYSGQNFGVGLIIDGSTVLASTITGTSGDDTITGGTGNDTISGSFGEDAIDGGQGNDTLRGGAGNDTFTIGSGTDTIGDLGTGDVFSVAAGAEVRATIDRTFTATNATKNLGGANTDARVIAGINATGVDMSLASVTNAATDGFHILIDVIATGSYIGSAGDDIINNTNNINGVTITGGAGADNMDGSNNAPGGLGNPNDVFIIAAAAHHAAGEDIDGNNGTDTIRFTSTTANETLTLNAGVTVETIEISDATGDNTGTTNLNLDASNMAADQDVLLIGNRGNNTLVGNGGDNTIEGIYGADTLTGGGGVDTFIFTGNPHPLDGADTITDFTAGVGGDLIDLDIDLSELRGTGAVAQSMAAGDALVADTGLIIAENDLANVGAFITFVLNLGNENAGDRMYILGSTDYDAAAGVVSLYYISVTTPNTTATAYRIAEFNAFALNTLTADNLNDYAAIAALGV